MMTVWLAPTCLLRSLVCMGWHNAQMAHMSASRRADLDETMLQLTAVAAEFMWDVLTPTQSAGNLVPHSPMAIHARRKDDPLAKLRAGGLIPRMSRATVGGAHGNKHGLSSDLDNYGMWHMGGTGQARSCAWRRGWFGGWMG